MIEHTINCYISGRQSTVTRKIDYSFCDDKEQLKKVFRRWQSSLICVQ